MTYKKIEKIFLLILACAAILFSLHYFFFEVDWISIYTSTDETKNIAILNESCIKCHGEVSGFSKFHNPMKIGCASCHLGDTLKKEKLAAHKRMIKIPGNLADVKLTCGKTNCHPGIPERVESSLMTTMSGVVSVNKFAFEEINSPSGKFHIKDIGYSAAESHMRNLCASCHLGNPKTEFGPINETSRGGGCIACHLNYSEDALLELYDYDLLKSTSPDSALLKVHPSLSLEIKNDHCFGCHSRSGRISTSYEGWHESNLLEKENEDQSQLRKLADGRIFRKLEADLHFKAGLVCVDCHISYEVMGDGNFYEHKEDQKLLECEDCHSKHYDRSIKLNDFDIESKNIAKIMGLDDEDRRFLKVKKSNTPLLNTFFDNRQPKLQGKQSNLIYDLNPPKFECISTEAHSNVSCKSCHTAWAPQCIGCHTEFQQGEEGYDLLANNITGSSWVEYHGEFFAGLPTLGISENNFEGKIERTVETFIPGMIMTIDKDNYPNSAPELIFKRLFSPVSAHTIIKESRSCKSCHNNSLALGYGRGKIEYIIHNDIGRWIFEPEYQKSEFDNLPEDAWIGFLEQSSKLNSTRNNTRPFNLHEQKKILTVGACLNCHEPDSDVMRNSLSSYQEQLKILSPECILPSWN